jgi:hypothetical protein
MQCDWIIHGMGRLWSNQMANWEAYVRRIGTKLRPVGVHIKENTLEKRGNETLMEFL